MTEVTGVPSRIRAVAVAAAASVGTAPNQGASRKLRHDRWSYVYAACNPSSSARRPAGTGALLGVE